MKVNQCMTSDVATVSPDDTIERAAQIMGSVDAGVLPVANGERLVGMITDRDMAIRGMAEGKGPEAKVRDCMSSEVRWCFEDDDVADCLETMAGEQIRRIPVLSRAKRLVGIVSLGDLTEAARPQAAGRTLSAISRQGGQHSQSLH